MPVEPVKLNLNLLGSPAGPGWGVTTASVAVSPVWAVSKGLAGSWPELGSDLDSSRVAERPMLPCLGAFSGVARPAWGWVPGAAWAAVGERSEACLSDVRVVPDSCAGGEEEGLAGSAVPGEEVVPGWTKPDPEVPSGLPLPESAAAAAAAADRRN